MKKFIIYCIYIEIIIVICAALFWSMKSHYKVDDYVMTDEEYYYAIQEFEDKQNESDTQEQRCVYELKKCLNRGDDIRIATLFHYPIKRNNSLPDIKDQTDFYQNYHSLFDSDMIYIIRESNLYQMENWGERGMFLGVKRDGGYQGVVVKGDKITEFLN